jgi:hypothetical protein
VCTLGVYADWVAAATRENAVQCPGCCQNSLSVRHRLWIAARAGASCPACGVAIRLGFWPRVAQTLFGEGLLLLGVVGAFALQAPFLIALASGSWLSLALLLPAEPAGSRGPHA